MDIQNGKHFAGQRRSLARLPSSRRSRDKVMKFHQEFSTFPFSFPLMFDQTIINLIVCMMISQKLHTKVAHVTEGTREACFLVK